MSISQEDARILEILRKFEEDNIWASEESDKLRTKYEGKVLAIKNKSIVSYADTVEELLKKLKQIGEDASFLLIEAIPPRNVSFIL